MAVPQEGASLLQRMFNYVFYLFIIDYFIALRFSVIVRKRVSQQVIGGNHPYFILVIV